MDAIPDATQLRVVLHERAGVAIAGIIGEADVSTVDVLTEGLRALADADRVVVDLAQLRFIDSVGLRTLFDLVREARHRKTTIAVSSPRTSVLRVLSITGMNHVVAIYEDLDTACAALTD